MMSSLRGDTPPDTTVREDVGRKIWGGKYEDIDDDVV